MLNEHIMIINQLGLHARAASKLVSTASRFKSTVRISKESKEVDAKSIMSVMMLAASCGTTVTLSIDGPDEADAMSALKALINDRFGEAQ
jgi:phosphocarrier protein HPr